MYEKITFCFSFTRIILICVEIFLITGDLNADQRYVHSFPPPDSLSYIVNPNHSATEGTIAPDDYRLGPGDKLLIVIRALEEKTVTATVDLEGNLYIPTCGIALVAGSTLTDAKDKINSLVRQSYKDVRVTTSLIDFRNIRVYVYGAVRRAGSYIIAANVRLNDLLAIAGGTAEKANIRAIRIKHKSEVTEAIDLLSFYRFGDFRNDPYLTEGDYIYLDISDKMIFASGAVKLPGQYDWKENEDINAFINLCGGLLTKARTDSIELIRYADDNRTLYSSYYSVDEIKSKKILLRNYDRVVVREIPRFLEENVVYVEGFVKYPGPYKIIENKTTLSDLINEAGGFLDKASLADASVSRQSGTEENDPEYERLKTIQRADMTDDEYDYVKSKSRQHKGRVIVDFEKLFHENRTNENIILRNNDLISVPEKRDYIILIGQVVQPGKIPYQQNLTIEQYIQMAGGFGWRALKKDVRLVKANTGEWIDADDVKEIHPGDIIWVPEDPPSPRFWDLFTRIFTVLGQVATVVAALVAVIQANK